MRKSILIICMLVACLLPMKVDVKAACTIFGFCRERGKDYWYEDGKKQGQYGDPKNIWDKEHLHERGREIYDPKSNGWYWLDAVYNGAAAYDKEVWMPYIFQDEKPGSTDGKWVRYSKTGKMIKGWYLVEGRDIAIYPEQEGNKYYYDWKTGAMYKGTHTIDGVKYHFDEKTGVMDGVTEPEAPIDTGLPND